MNRNHQIAIAMFAALFVVAVPWYWQFMPTLAVRVVGGFPLWVLTSIVGSALIACTIVWTVLACWPDDEQEPSTNADDAQDDR